MGQHWLTRRRLLVVGGMAVLVMIALGYVISRYEPLYSSPRALRDDFAYRQTFRGEPKLPDDRRAFFESIKLKQKIANPQVAYVDRQRAHGYGLDYKISFATNRASVKMEGDQVTLQTIGVAYCRSRPSRTNAFELPAEASYFDADLKPIPNPEAQSGSAGDPDPLGFRGRFPRVRFVFRNPGLEGMKTLRARLFDGQTRKAISNYHGWDRITGSSYRIEFDLQAWHATPVKLVWDLAHGSPETVRLPVKAGEMAAFSQGAVKLLMVLDEGYRGITQHTRSRGQVQMLRLRPDRSSKGEATTFVFACYPQANPLPIDWGFLDQRGKVLPQKDTRTAGRLKIVSLNHPSASIETIRLRIYPELSRLVFNFPRIPGLPNANREIANLFDVTMPYVRFKAAFELRNTLERTLQMRLAATSRATFPPAYFPREFIDVTPRRLLREYLEYCRPPKHVRLDHSEQLIHIGKGPVERLMEDLKGFLR